MSEFPIDVDLLISLVEDHRVLWDKNLDEYKNTKLTSAAWRNVTLLLIENFEQFEEVDKIEIGKLVKKKWANLRDAWLKYMKRQREVKKTKKYLYSDQMNFLSSIYCEPYNETLEEFSQQYKFSEEAGDLGSDADASADMYIERSMDNNALTMDPSTFQIMKKCKIETEEQTAASPEDNNRHMLFFRGVLPSVIEFSEDETIEFQMGVLSLIKSIKRTKYSSTASSSATD